MNIQGVQVSFGPYNVVVYLLGFLLINILADRWADGGFGCVRKKFREVQITPDGSLDTCFPMYRDADKSR